MDVLLLALLDSKEVAAALQESGLSKSQLEAAIEETRGHTNVDSATGDSQVGVYKFSHLTNSYSDQMGRLALVCCSSSVCLLQQRRVW